MCRNAKLFSRDRMWSNEVWLQNWADLPCSPKAPPCGKSEGWRILHDPDPFVFDEPRAANVNASYINVPFFPSISVLPCQGEAASSRAAELLRRLLQMVSTSCTLIVDVSLLSKRISVETWFQAGEDELNGKAAEVADAEAFKKLRSWR